MGHGAEDGELMDEVRRSIPVDAWDLLLLVTNISYMNVDDVEPLAQAAARAMAMLREWDRVTRS